jgi:hypothetical protein
MADNPLHLQQADSFGETYSHAIGDKKKFDDAFAKWAKKRNIRTGFPKKMNSSFKSEATLAKEAEEAKSEAKAKEVASNHTKDACIKTICKAWKVKSIDKLGFLTDKKVTVTLPETPLTKAGKHRLRFPKVIKVIKSEGVSTLACTTLVAALVALRKRLEKEEA